MATALAIVANKVASSVAISRFLALPGRLVLRPAHRALERRGEGVTEWGRRAENALLSGF